MKERGGEFTWAGAFDDSYRDYSEMLRAMPHALVVPMLDPHRPDAEYALEEDSAFLGTVGAFGAVPALVTPAGPWMPDYGGDLPLQEQPKVPGETPWLSDYAP